MGLGIKGKTAIVTDINGDLAQATTAELKAEGLSVHCIVGDITQAADVQPWTRGATASPSTAWRPASWTPR